MSVIDPLIIHITRCRCFKSDDGVGCLILIPLAFCFQTLFSRSISCASYNCIVFSIDP